VSRRVLVVDDDHDMVSTLCDILELKGWTTDRAYSGEDALDRARDDPPDVVVMDIKMGGMNGVETLRCLRRTYPRLKVVLMTAYSAAELVKEAQDSGAVDVLAKPVDPDRLISVLRSHEGASRRVLIVDDDRPFLTTLSAAIEAAGYEVLRAASLGDALEHLTHASVDVVLLDIVLPGHEPETCVMASRGASPSTIFILFSGYPDVLDATRRLLPDQWVRACMHKPLDLDELIRILDEHPQH
jgi:DNA-binding NtrC family response regulator